jgi:hypothetical protein
MIGQVVVFASDNGPQGEVVRQFGGDMPDMGSLGPFRGGTGRCQQVLVRREISAGGLGAPHSSQANKFTNTG